MDLRKKTVLAFVFIGLVSLGAIRYVEPQSASAISIRGDGSVLGTDKLQRVGSLYSLTDNLYDSPIIVECNNIVLDGKGFTLQGVTGWVSGLCAINLTCSNVTVRNFNIIGFWEVGILGAYNGNTISNNNITKTDRAISIYADNYNVTGNYLSNNDKAVRIKGNDIVIIGNQILNNSDGFSITDGTGNIIVANDIENNGIAINTDYGDMAVYHNNFVNQTKGFGGSWSAIALLTTYYSQGVNVTLPPWDNAYPSGGNYWSDYFIFYPNATEIGNSGIGDTQYFIGVPCAINSSTINAYIVEAVDRYPLIAPFNISEPVIPIQKNSSPSPSPSPSPAATPLNTEEESFPTALVVASVAAVIIVVIGLGLLVYFKKRNH